jgi:hypothetical protein
VPNAAQGARIGTLLSGPMNEVMSCIMGNLYPQVHNAAVLSLLQVCRVCNIIVVAVLEL